jgi:hypothetical protein
MEEVNFSKVNNELVRKLAKLENKKDVVVSHERMICLETKGDDVIGYVMYANGFMVFVGDSVTSHEEKKLLLPCGNASKFPKKGFSTLWYDPETGLSLDGFESVLPKIGIMSRYYPYSQLVDPFRDKANRFATMGHLGNDVANLPMYLSQLGIGYNGFVSIAYDGNGSLILSVWANVAMPIVDHTIALDCGDTPWALYNFYDAEKLANVLDFVSYTFDVVEHNNMLFIDGMYVSSNGDGLAVAIIAMPIYVSEKLKAERYARLMPSVAVEVEAV